MVPRGNDGDGRPDMRVAPTMLRQQAFNSERVFEMIKTLYVAATSGTMLTISPTIAQTPMYHWGNDTRGMSQEQCMKNARFAMGEQGLSVNGETGTDVAGA